VDRALSTKAALPDASWNAICAFVRKRDSAIDVLTVAKRVKDCLSERPFVGQSEMKAVAERSG